MNTIRIETKTVSRALQSAFFEGWSCALAQDYAGPKEAQQEWENSYAKMYLDRNQSTRTELEKKHGTPEEFEVACINAIGVISSSEANVAIKKYREEWEAAPQGDEL